MKKVSCIIPSYNEEKNISQVLKTATESLLISEVIVVNDGSTDSTEEAVKSGFPQVKIVSQKNNRGKASAMVLGAKNAKYPILFFCDADLTNFNAVHVKELLSPLLKGETRMVVGAQEFMDTLKKQTDGKMNDFVKGLGGEKVIYKKDFLKIPDLENSNYAVEYKIINFFDKNKWPYKKIILKGAGHIHKISKWGLKGLTKEAGALLTFAKQWIGLRLRHK